jgi:hypothetical protein
MHRQNALFEQIKQLRGEITALKNNEFHKKRVEEVSILVRQSGMQLKEIEMKFRDEIENNYRKQIEVL